MICKYIWHISPAKHVFHHRSKFEPVGLRWWGPRLCTFLKILFIIIWERLKERERAEVGAEGEVEGRERIPNRVLPTWGSIPWPCDHTWPRVGCLADWATQAPREFAFLTSFQVMLMLLDWGPHFENHWSKQWFSEPWLHVRSSPPPHKVLWKTDCEGLSQKNNY